MKNLLIELYESGLVSEQSVTEFKRWHHGIEFCGVCGDKLMHEDEAYTDEITGVTLCDRHAIFNELTDMNHSPSISEIEDEIKFFNVKLSASQSVNYKRGVDEYTKKVTSLKTFLSKIILIKLNKNVAK